MSGAAHAVLIGIGNPYRRDDGISAPPPGGRQGVADAVRLAAALNMLPRRLIAFGVEAADIGFGPGLSPAVAAAVPELVQAVLAEFAVG
jgi:Ni,Fe-hydrogenase maturation factor